MISPLLNKAFASAVLLLLLAAADAFGQVWKRELTVAAGGTVEVVNKFGRVDVSAFAAPAASPEGEATPTAQEPASFVAAGGGHIADSEIEVTTSGKNTRIEVNASGKQRRIDLKLSLPERTRVKIETLEGEVRVDGNFERLDVVTDTGTIAVDVPTDDLRYDFVWTTSRPRYLSDFELEKVKERSGGRFQLKGSHKGGESSKNDRDEPDLDGEEIENPPPADVKKKKKRSRSEETASVALNFITARGIVLLNVPENEVSSDLRPRPLTEAAKAIIRSGDKVLTDAIRRASPKYFGDYSRTLPPVRREPELTLRTTDDEGTAGGMKRVSVRVTDQFNRAVPGLAAADFVVTENGEEREIVSIEPTTAPFNLVLLLDVSGSVDNYVNFIRKAARSFVDTVDRRDRISIVLFNEDVKVLSRFTTDKDKLSGSLDTFDAGGPTAFYDALAYTLADTLRPLKGERTAIVILTDGDDNRSFLSFDGLLGAVQESGALIYPLYVPSGLVAATETNRVDERPDPLRARYIGLTTKAEGEGAKLANISGGIYYSITQLEQIQQAYNDIVVQLRTAYALTYRSAGGEAGNGRVSPRTKVRVKRPNTFTALGPIVRVGAAGVQ